MLHKAPDDPQCSSGVFYLIQYFSIMPQSSILALQKLRQLLQIEYEQEKQLFQNQTEVRGIERSVRQGLCWHPVKIGRSYYNSLNQFVIEVERHENEEQEHQFEPGKPVCFFTQDASGMVQKGLNAEGKLHHFKFFGQVTFVEDNRMVISLPGPEAATLLQNAWRVGVHLSIDETTYRLMFDALDRTMRAETGRLAVLRELFHGNKKEAECFSFPPLRFPWLNSSQEMAVNKVLRAKDVAIVHGPPGTGKTTTLVEAVYETLHRESQVLVCAQSNMAVDWIAEKLADRGVAVLRIGNPMRVTDRMLECTYERRFESHPHYTQLWSIRKAIRELYAQRKHSSDAFHQKVARLKERATELEIAINEDLFNEARVIACTLAGSANKALIGKKFSTLFIDEAAQALEPACWIALQKAGKVILAGDHQQLPPTVKSVEALSGGLGKTLMQTIVEKLPGTVSLLEIQYRMNEEIMRFSSDWFYNGLLKSAPEVKYRGILDWDTSMEWFDTDAENDTAYHEHTDGMSRSNPKEAEQTLCILKTYLEKIGKHRILEERIDIGLISPYKGQVILLRRMLRHDTFFKPYRHLISINTVDGFQGQERDIVVISMVRANETGNIGFLNDLRRMNVAITRARMKLILVGNSATLCHHPFYRKLYAYTKQLKEADY